MPPSGRRQANVVQKATKAAAPIITIDPVNTMTGKSMALLELEAGSRRFASFWNRSTEESAFELGPSF